MASPNALSSPISIGWSSNSSPGSRSSSFSSTSSASSTWDAFSFVSTSNTGSLACAFPSWPSRSTLSPTFSAQRDVSYGSNNFDVPNAYISDFDLFPEDLEDDSTVPVLEEAPAPPREAPAMPLLPLFAPERPRKKRSSSRKQSKLSKAMTPIAESPLAPE
jgi:hypothetical protein